MVYVSAQVDELQVQLLHLERHNHVLAGAPSSDGIDGLISLSPKEVRLSLQRLYSHGRKLLIYNRIPKTGSTTLANLAYDLCDKNQFSMMFLNISRSSRVLNIVDQAHLAHNLSNWVDRHPILCHGHVNFVDFQRFGYANPLYINMLREPLERYVSYYYFIRNGDDYRPHVHRRFMGENMTLDECLVRQSFKCSAKLMWVQVPIFCGQAPECLEPGSEWALNEAKWNLLHRYLLVGITEEIPEFIALLEILIPDFFKGATEKFMRGTRSHLRRTRHKLPLSAAAEQTLKETSVWKMENEFYQFAKSVFSQHKQNVLTRHGSGQINVASRRFHYDKVFIPNGRQ